MEECFGQSPFSDLFRLIHVWCQRCQKSAADPKNGEESQEFKPEIQIVRAIFSKILQKTNCPEIRLQG